MLTEHGCSIASSTYYAFNNRDESARSVRDTELKDLITAAYEDNFRVYGARKIWRELNRRGHAVARCAVERLMCDLGITGAVRGKHVVTTVSDPSAQRAPDLVDRDFVASAPNRCWVADFTHVAAFAGVVYDTSFRLAERLDVVGIAASIGSVGDAYDNALMESMIGSFKTELIKPRRPWRTLSPVALVRRRLGSRFRSTRWATRSRARSSVSCSSAIFAVSYSTRRPSASMRPARDHSPPPRPRAG
ncbi:IS3 family transposase [Kitasatospora cineracea]|uniref:IS3 family transposase n=1 Tax=Kitasatospora cineracea TaxID=88074 RepID=UPI003423E628